MFKLHEICQFGEFIFGENNSNRYHHISSFKAKMRQIRFRLELRPGPR